MTDLLRKGADAFHSSVSASFALWYNLLNINDRTKAHKL